MRSYMIAFDVAATVDATSSLTCEAEELHLCSFLRKQAKGAIGRIEPYSFMEQSRHPVASDNCFKHHPQQAPHKSHIWDPVLRVAFRSLSQEGSMLRSSESRR